MKNESKQFQNVVEKYQNLKKPQTTFQAPCRETHLKMQFFGKTPAPRSLRTPPPPPGHDNQDCVDTSTEGTSIGPLGGQRC